MPCTLFGHSGQLYGQMTVELSNHKPPRRYVLLGIFGCDIISALTQFRFCFTPDARPSLSLSLADRNVDTIVTECCERSLAIDAFNISL